MSEYIPNQFPRNLTTLREHYKLTQAELATILGSTQKNISAYERQRAFPKADTMATLLDHFNVSYEMVTQMELFALSQEELEKTLHPSPQDSNSFPILVVGDDNEEKVVLVDQKAQAGYPVGIQDETFFESLPTFSLPALGPGTFRAFEITGFSMLPIRPGSIVIGQYLEKPDEVKDGKAYLVVLPDGIVFKRLYHGEDEAGTPAFLCVSDNPEFKPFFIPKRSESLLEIWTAHRLISAIE